MDVITRRKVVGEISAVINRNSLENDLDMPDFLIAEMLVSFFEGTVLSHRANQEWHSAQNPQNPEGSDSLKSLGSQGGDVECDHTNLDTNICYKCGFGLKIK